MQERDIKAKNFVFVGGSHGMGRAAAVEIAKRGGAVLIVARGAQAGEDAVAAVLAAGASSADFIGADLSTIAGIQTAGEAIKAWRGEIHGIMHTAMSAFNKRIITSDQLDFAFALQYLARALLNRMLVDNLAASGDARIVHIAGNVSAKMADVDLNDLQFQHRKWSFFKSILGTHHLGFLHLQEFAKRYSDLPICATASCVESVKTKAMLDKEMPLIMRIMGYFGTTPELAARNAVTLLTTANTSALKAAIVPKSKQFEPQALALDPNDAAKLWQITTDIATEAGITLA